MSDISFEKAFNIVKSEHSEEQFKSCIEYDSMYVFSNDKKKLGSGLYAISKKDGHCFSFKPFYLSLEEYRNGKKIM